VQKVIAKLGYHRNATARSMRVGKTLAVGCIVSDIRQPVAAMMVTGAETVLRDAGYAMIVASTHYDDLREAEIMAFMRERAVDGLIMIVNRDADPNTVQRLNALKIPIVLWERHAGGVFDSVLTEHYAGAQVATEHLLALGHRDVALVAGHPDTWVGREQSRGFEEAFRRAGLAPPKRRVFHVGELGRAGLLRLLKMPQGPTAIVANIDEVPTVLSVCAALELSLPRDLSIVSIGDSDFLTLTTPQVTTVCGDPERVGERASTLLLERLNGRAHAAPERISVPMQLVVRASTAGPRTTD
jgi:LacI family transcriptional regulator